MTGPAAPAPVKRTPTELIDLYWTEVWNNGNVELVREICADPIVRHDPGCVTTLSHDEQVARIRHSREREPIFTHELLLADDKFVCSVWNMTIRKGERELCGIEVFQVEDGRLSRAWNSAYQPGFWGRDGAPSVPADLPPPRLLATHDEIDTSWLQQVFHHAGTDVPRLSNILGVEPIGQGTLSETARVRFVYNAAPGDHPQSVVCKFGRQSPAIDAANRRLRFYEREAEAYRFLSAEGGLPVPQVYLAATSDDGVTANLVLEDLTGRAVPGDQIAGCSVAQADAAVAALGQLHARFAGRDAPAWALDRAGRAEDMATSYRLGATALRERLGDALGAEDYGLIDRFADLYVDWARLPAPVRTFLHGDARADNIVFVPEGEAMQALLLDWQLCDVGTPAFDLAYFLTGSVGIDLRRAHEERWIADHAAALRAVRSDYGADAARESYRLQAVAGLAATVVASRTVQATEHGRALLLALTTRNCAAVADWGALDAIARATASAGSFRE